jgi:hypothetical protein
VSIAWTAWQMPAGTQVLHPVSSLRRTPARSGTRERCWCGHAAVAVLRWLCCRDAVSVAAAPQANGPAGPPTGTAVSLHNPWAASGPVAICGPPFSGIRETAAF